MRRVLLLLLLVLAACRGERGPTGPPGPPGIAGPIGERGLPGQDGSAVRTWYAFGIVPPSSEVLVPVPREASASPARPVVLACFVAWPNSVHLPYDGVWVPLVSTSPERYCVLRWMGDFYIVHIRYEPGWLFATVVIY